MPNAHLQTAAGNLERAAQDVRLLQQQTRHTIDETRRNANNRIQAIQKHIAELGVMLSNPNTDPTAKTLLPVQVQSANLEISRIQKDTNDYVHRLEQQIHGLDGQVAEFEGLANRLKSIA